MRHLPFVVLSMSATACGMRELPPVAAPAQEVPVVEDMPTSAPLPDQSRVIIDANGEHTRVLEVMSETHGFGLVNGRRSSMASITTRPVCGDTPCVADLTKGDHEIIFGTGQESTNVRVGDSTRVVRYAMGNTYISPVWKVGVVSASLGVVALAFSWMPYVFAGASRNQDTKDTFHNVGEGMLISGGIALVAGIIMTIVARPEHTPGSTTQWNLTAPAALPAGPGQPVQPPSPPLAPPPPNGGVQF